MFGPDVPSSISTSQLSQLVEGVRFIEKMCANPVDKDELAREDPAKAELVNAPPDLQPGTVGRILPRPGQPARP